VKRLFLLTALLLLGCAQPQPLSQPQEIVLGPAQPAIVQNETPNATPSPPQPQPIAIPVPQLQTQPGITVPTVSTQVNTTSPVIVATTPQTTEGPGIIVQPIVFYEVGVISGEANITIKNAAFRPKKLTIKNGTRVTWVNMDSYTHRISGNGFESENLTTGQSFSFVFERPGIYYYASVFYPQMQSGEIQVIE